MDKKRWRRETKGLDEAEITKVESQIGKKFPQAYREFLWLTGKQGFRAWSESHEIDYLIEKKVAEIVPKLVEEYGVDLPKDNYWVMAIENGSIDFFYFDEGENPPIYVCEYEGKEYIENYLRKVNDSLTEFIDNIIYYYNIMND